MSQPEMLWAGLVPFLLLVWIFQRLSRWQDYRGVLAGVFVAPAVMMIPWFGHPLPYWSAALSTNFSMILPALLVCSIAERAGARGWLGAAGWRAAWWLGGAGAVLLYPSAMGLGPRSFDVYALGWPWLFWGQSAFLFGGVSVLAAWLLWQGNRFGFLLLLSFAGYALCVQESRNFWDYLLDPVYAAIAMLLWVRGVIRGRRG